MQSSEIAEIHRLAYADPIVLKASILRELLPMRFVDLCNGAMGLAEQKMIVPGLALARAALETTALLWKLKQITHLLEVNEDMTSYTETLNRMLYGTALSGPVDVETKIAHRDAPYPLRIFKVIKEMAVEYPAIERLYETLCEYTHPNYHGLMGSYSKPALDADVLRIGRDQRPRPPEHVHAPISICIPIFEECFDGLADLLSQVNERLKRSR